MPVKFKSGGGKCWAQWGENATTKYEYKCGNESSKAKAYNKAMRQGIAIEISKGNFTNDPSQVSRERDQYQDSYKDYPKAASDNARKALEWIDKYGRDIVEAGTRVGLARANQLAKGEPISLETIRRIKAFFDRHIRNVDLKPEFKGKPYLQKGYVSGQLWGGLVMYEWAKRKLKQIENENG